MMRVLGLQIARSRRVVDVMSLIGMYRRSSVCIDLILYISIAFTCLQWPCPCCFKVQGASLW
jgi:hypothetical protein